MYQICCMPPQDQVNSGYLCWQFESGNSPWWKIEHHRAMPTLDIHCLDVNGLHLFPDDRDAELLSRLSRLLVMETIFLLGHSTRRIRDCTSSCWVLMQVPPLQQSRMNDTSATQFTAASAPSVDTSGALGAWISSRVSEENQEKPCKSAHLGRSQRSIQVPSGDSSTHRQVCWKMALMRRGPMP